MQTAHFVRAAAVLFGVVLVAPAFAAKLGTPQILMKKGERVSIDIPIELSPGEQLVKAAVAQSRVYGALGLVFPPSLQTATVSIRDSQGASVLHLAGGVSKADSLPVVLEIDTNNGQVVRQFLAPISQVAATPHPAEPTMAATPRVTAEPLAEKKRKSQAPVTERAAETARQAAEAEFEARMDTINQSIARVAEGINDISAEFKRDNLAREKQTAALLLLVPPPKQETPWIDDLTLMGGAAILGMSLAAAWFVGSRPRLPAGTSVFLVGPGRTPIEGKFVRVTSQSYGKPLPYRLADLLTGAPKRIELVWPDDADTSFTANDKKTASSVNAHATVPDSVTPLRPFHRRDVGDGHEAPATEVRNAS
jgi:hypothetical protein